MTFKYFRDYENFTYLVDKPMPCSFCSAVGRWPYYYGEDDQDKPICPDCLNAGKLIDLDVWMNDVVNQSEVIKVLGEQEGHAVINQIVYMTPKLPTWQDLEWPFQGNDFCVFEKIASKVDFEDKEEFINSFSQEDQDISDLDFIWDGLPEHPIRNIKEGQYSACVYLFTSGNKKRCLWDAD